MQPHDKDKIPVLKDIIHEHEVAPAGEAETNDLQKPLWDDGDTGFGGETASGADTQTPDEPAAGIGPGEFFSAADINQPATGGDEAPYDQNGNIISRPDAAAERPQGVREESTESDSVDLSITQTGQAFTDYSRQRHEIEAGEPDPAAAVPAGLPQDQPGYAASGMPDASAQQPPDPDRLADDILHELMPDLEDYLRRSIANAVHAALRDKPAD